MNRLGSAGNPPQGREGCERDCMFFAFSVRDRGTWDNELFDQNGKSNLTEYPFLTRITSANEVTRVNLISRE